MVISQGLYGSSTLSLILCTLAIVPDFCLDQFTSHKDIKFKKQANLKNRAREIPTYQLLHNILYRPLRLRSGCLYCISVLKALIKRKNFEIFQSAIFYVKMPITCCVYQCHNRQGKPNTRFFSFSKDEGRKGRWIAAIRRDKWQPSKYSKVCSTHFKQWLVTISFITQ